jgi:hypothetical protein
MRIVKKIASKKERTFAIWTHYEQHLLHGNHKGNPIHCRDGKCVVI